MVIEYNHQASIADVVDVSAQRKVDDQTNRIFGAGTII